MLKKYFKIFLVPLFLSIVLLPHVASAVDWVPIVPCGLSAANAHPAGATRMDTLPDGTKVPHDYSQDCNQCLLVELGKNIIDMVFFAIVPAVGTLLFMIAGFIILFSARSGNSGGVGKGKEIMTNTAIGIAIILSAWLITNFIFTSLANNQVASTPWYQIQCRTGSLKDLADATIPTIGGTTPATGGAGANYNCSANATCEALPSGQVGTYSGATALSDCQQQCEGVTSPTTGTGTGGQCPDSNINICQAAPSASCGNSSCSQYDASIATYGKGAATPSLLKAIMFTESSCNPKAFNAGGSSYGLMELQVATAVKNYQGCVANSSVINSTWLTTPANSDAVICIAANYIRSLVSACGTNVGDLAANYNGNNACVTSQDCTGSICGDSPPKAWQCLYDDTAHTQCNANRATGSFLETRKYVPNILYCVNNNNPGFQ